MNRNRPRPGISMSRRRTILPSRRIMERRRACPDEFARQQRARRCLTVNVSRSHVSHQNLWHHVGGRRTLCCSLGSRRGRTQFLRLESPAYRRRACPRDCRSAAQWHRPSGSVCQCAGRRGRSHFSSSSASTTCRCMVTSPRSFWPNSPGGQSFVPFEGQTIFDRSRPISAACRSLGPAPAAVLVDAFQAGRYGGTGQSPDWSAVAQARPAWAGVPLVLAGGLTAANVAAAIQQVRPTAVDTASGVESSPGRKSADRVADFIAAARGAFKGLQNPGH